MVKMLLSALAIPYWTLAYLLVGLDDEYYHIKLGDAYLQLRFYWKAVSHFTSALKEKERAWSHLQLGWALHCLNQFEDALPHYRRAFNLWPDPALAATLAKTEWSFGNNERSRELAQIARAHLSRLNKESLAILAEVEAELSKVTSGAS